MVAPGGTTIASNDVAIKLIQNKFLEYTLATSINRTILYPLPNVIPELSLDPQATQHALCNSVLYAHCHRSEIGFISCSFHALTCAAGNVKCVKNILLN